MMKLKKGFLSFWARCDFGTMTSLRVQSLLEVQYTLLIVLLYLIFINLYLFYLFILCKRG